MNENNPNLPLPPLCFVLMPFGTKQDSNGRPINFDALYKEVIEPAVTSAGMQALRADEERDGGIIHKPMLERLVLCTFAVADLTLANANVFYELGVRHAARPHTTVLLFAQGGQRLPFDVAPLRALPYSIDEFGKVEDPARIQATIRERLDSARDPTNDSPLYQLLDGFQPPNIASLKTDVFRERVRYSEDAKIRLATARTNSTDPTTALQREHDKLKPLADKDAAIAVDLLLSYRSISEHQSMIDLVSEMSPPVAASAFVREQLAFALNRIERHHEAEDLLLKLIDEQGPSSESFGLLGRVYKDRWEKALKSNSPSAPALLEKSILTYMKGFEADWRDSYPGINAITLMERQKPGQSRIAKIAPVVRYSSLRRIAQFGSEYWDRATLLELAVIERNDDEVAIRLGEALAERSEKWMLETTARNLEVIASCRATAGEPVQTLSEIIEQLLNS